MNSNEQALQRSVEELYWLAYLITGDRERSIEAFARGLGSDESGPGFREFWYGWVRKLVIGAALDTIRWELKRSRARTESGSTRWRIPNLSAPPDLKHLSRKDIEEALLAMDVFPRCTYLLAVLEDMPEEEVSVLLDADRKLLRFAKVQGAVEFARNLSASGREAACPFGELASV
jgi:DNA-directed RNA polymerase specialized sigma24 family protein